MFAQEIHGVEKMQRSTFLCVMWIMNSIQHGADNKEVFSSEKKDRLNRSPILLFVTAFSAYIQRQIFYLFYCQFPSIDHIQQSHSRRVFIYY